MQAGNRDLGQLPGVLFWDQTCINRAQPVTFLRVGAAVRALHLCPGRPDSPAEREVLSRAWAGPGGGVAVPGTREASGGPNPTHCTGSSLRPVVSTLRLEPRSQPAQRSELPGLKCPDEEGAS